MQKVKRYPFSRNRNEHNLLLIQNIAYNRGDMELFEEVIALKEKLFWSDRGNGVGYLEGKEWARATQLVEMAKVHRFEANATFDALSEEAQRTGDWTEFEEWYYQEDNTDFG